MYQPKTPVEDGGVTTLYANAYITLFKDLKPKDFLTVSFTFRFKPSTIPLLYCFLALK
jgi:hypothetical protein